MLKLKDDVKLEQLEKYGFKNGIYQRIKNNQVLYWVVITSTHRYIQIRLNLTGFINIAGSLQDLIYDLIQAGLVEKVDK